MNQTIKNIIRPYYKFCMLIIKLNITKTLYINFRKLPFKQAIKLPIFVYGKLKIKCLKGKIIIRAPIKTGLIQIGFNMDGVPLSMLPVQLYICGKVIFYGYAIISKGTTLYVQGEMSIGNCCTIGSGCFVKSIHKIILNDNVQITYGCTLFDCDMHYVKNIETGVVKNNRTSIIIGKNCWINAGTIVAKGVVLPDYSITARNSYLNKDYSEYGTNLFLVGSPAKPLKSRVQRIFSTIEEQRLKRKFAEMGVEEIQCSADLFDEKDDNELFFKNL